MKPFRYPAFDLRQLTSFAEIVRIGSYRGAAKTLHVAQPALSRQIQNLENALGIVLFERGLRRLRLTAACELATRLPGLFAHIDRITECTQFASRGTAGHLRVGDAGVATTEILLPALRTLRKQWPDLRLSFFQNTSEGFFNDLIEDKIDCAFAMLPSSHPDLLSHRLISLEIGIVLPPGHRLAKQKEVPLGALRDESWIMAPRAANPLLYDEIIGCCHRAGFSPHIIDEVSPRPRNISQVACGVAVTTLIESVKHLCIGGTIYRRLVQPTPKITCYLVCRRNDPSALLQAMISLCRTQSR
jgi:DNA-binding transcriptional LysR family regulator